MEKQEVWDVDIFTNIKKVLTDSRKEILVATAWFTDNDLYNILVNKRLEGLVVKVLLSDHDDNKRLDFNYLSSLGVQVVVVPSNGRGMMHDKFCVIDNKIVVSGSYNWTLNARRNNSESVIYTQNLDTVKSFREKFDKMVENVEAQKSIALIDNKRLGIMDFIKKPFKTNIKAETQSVQDSSLIKNSSINNLPKDELEQNLDLIISSEASDFDRNVLNEKGYSLAKKNNGDYKVIFKALDSIYSIFIYEIDIIEEKKRRLIAKIKEYEIKVIDLLKSKASTNISNIESKSIADTENIQRKIDELNLQIESNKKTINDITDIKKKHKLDKIEDFKEKILGYEIDFIKPKFNWIELITNSFISIGLLVYLFLFYSSAGYILLYSVEDARVAKMLKTTATSQEVFNSKAFSMALDKGVVSFLFILLFVFVPLGCAIFSSYIKKDNLDIKIGILRKIWRSLLYWSKKYILIVIVDGFIAYKVAESLHKSAYLSGNINEQWSNSMVFRNLDFYLVFVLGTFAVFLFEVLFAKVKNSINARNSDVVRFENNLLIKQKKSKIIEIKEEINILDIEKSDFEKKNIELKNTYDALQRELIYIPNQSKSDVKKIMDKQNEEIHSIENKVAVYVSNIENDRFPISVDALKDRINIFLEGWNEWLHNEYAVEKAKLLSEKARDEADEWKQVRISAGLNSNIINN